MMLFDDMVTVHVEIIVIFTSVGPWLLYIYCTTLLMLYLSREVLMMVRFVVAMHKQGGMVVSCPYSWVWCN